MNLEGSIYQQNPQWSQKDYFKPELDWFYRPYYEKSLSWLDKRLIIALTGLRRTGKSTILQQIKYNLEEKIPKERVFYFSFEKSQVKFHPDSLREILYWYFETFLRLIPQKLPFKIYFFLDEIQYIPYWQDVLKTFYDQSPQIKFLISGSSSLFIRKKATESLAGRMIEIIVEPLSFAEFRQINNIMAAQTDLEKNLKASPNLVNSHFEDYLNFGQFPELVKDNYTQELAKGYLSSIEEKILEQDLPKIYPIRRVDILRLIFNFIKTNHSHILEFKNLAADLGVDLKTTSKYFDYLQKAYLTKICLNSTKKAVKSARTAKKIYLTSTNFSEANLGQKIENYVYNLLSRSFSTQFFRKKNFEVDFVIKTNKGLLPCEVKYTEKLKQDDYKNMIKLALLLKARKACLVSKNTLSTYKKKGVTVQIIPACLLESKVATFDK